MVKPSGLFPIAAKLMVELRGLEPLTSCLQSRMTEIKIRLNVLKLIIEKRSVAGMGSVVEKQGVHMRRRGQTHDGIALFDRRGNSTFY